MSIGNIQMLCSLCSLSMLLVLFIVSFDSNNLLTIILYFCVKYIAIFPCMNLQNSGLVVALSIVGRISLQNTS